MNMRKFLLAAPWVTASVAAIYAISRWNRLPARMAVHFTSFMGIHPNGWHPKTVAIPVMLLLMLGIVAVVTVMLSMPDKIYVREGVLSDPVEDKRQMLRLLLAMHILVGGVLLPLSVVRIVDFNLQAPPQASPTVKPLGNSIATPAASPLDRAMA
jgi:hypothetical protein